MQQMQVDLHNSQNLGQAQQQAIGMQSLQAMQGGQVPAEWQHGRVQLLPQTIPGQYLPQVYGQQLVMPNNILHPGLGQQQIQLVASNSKFQGGQLMPQMITTNAQGKQVLSGGPGNFSYTLPSNQPQTLLFSPVGVINSQQQQQQQQQNIMAQAQAAANQQNQQQNQGQNQNQSQQANSGNNSTPGTPVKSDQDQMQKNNNNSNMSGQKIMQKVGGGNGSAPSTPTNSNNPQQQQCVQVPQGMQTAQIISPIQQANQQFAPWLSNVTPQLWQQQFVHNGIIFRGAQPDGSQNMFIQHNPQGGGQPQVLQANSTITLPCNMVAQAQQQQQQQQNVTNQAGGQMPGGSVQNSQLALTNSVVANANNVNTGNKVRIAGAGEIAPKQQQQLAGRGPAILPQQPGGAGNLRPSIAASTQTAQNQNLMKQSKLRAKPSPVRAINPQGLKPQDGGGLLVATTNTNQGMKQSPQQQQQQQQQISNLQALGGQMHVASMGNK